MQNFPGVLLSPIACSSGDGLAALDADTLDALVLGVLKGGRHLSRYPDYVASFICGMPISVAVSCGSALNAKTSLTFEDLRGHSFAQLDHDGLKKLAIIEACNRHGFIPPYIGSPSQSGEDFWGSVASGQAVALLHAWPSCASEHPQCSFVPLLHAGDLALDVYLVHRRKAYCGEIAYLEEALASSLAPSA